VTEGNGFVDDTTAEEKRQLGCRIPRTDVLKKLRFGFDFYGIEEFEG
jgi:hypothetical protein